MPSRVRQASSAHLTRAGMCEMSWSWAASSRSSRSSSESCLAADHGEEELCQAASFLDGLAGDEIGHDVGAGLADGAAVAGKGGLLDHVVLDTQLQR